jgi:PAS domain S-box-containing protein
MQERRTRNLLEIINDGVIRFDRQGEILSSNPAFNKIMNIDQEQRSGLNFFSLFNEKQKAILVEQLNELDDTKQPQYGVINYPLGNSELRHIDYMLSFASLTQEETFFVARFSDITEVVNKEKNLNYIIQKEKELNTSKSQFVRITSHELRTPLAIILSNAEILSLLTSEPELSNPGMMCKSINRIVKEVNMMTEILNQLMIISKIEEGKIDFDPAEIEINDIIEEIKNEFFNPYKDGRVLQIDITANNLSLCCDRRLFRPAVMNLLTNAFKYSAGAQAPTICVAESNEAVLITVTDYGIGIPQGDVQHLFSPFFRASNVGVIQGTGLGLMVVEYAIKKHQGSIDFKSDVGKGTSFTLTFPKKTTYEQHNDH